MAAKQYVAGAGAAWAGDGGPDRPRESIATTGAQGTHALSADVVVGDLATHVLAGDRENGADGVQDVHARAEGTRPASLAREVARAPAIIGASLEMVDASRVERSFLEDVADLSPSAQEKLLREIVRGNLWFAGTVREDWIAPLAKRVEDAVEAVEARARRDGYRASLPELVGAAVRAIETWIVMKALREAGGNKARAADRLGISRHKLYEVLKATCGTR